MALDNAHAARDAGQRYSGTYLAPGITHAPEVAKLCGGTGFFGRSVRRLPGRRLVNRAADIGRR